MRGTSRQSRPCPSGGEAGGGVVGPWGAPSESGDWDYCHKGRCAVRSLRQPSVLDAPQVGQSAGARSITLPSDANKATTDALIASIARLSTSLQRYCYVQSAQSSSA